MKVDGSGRKRLTFNKWDDIAPIWSPDGKKIMFESIRESGKHDIYIMNADGSNTVNLTTRPNSLDNHPKFFEDGSKIIFNSSRDSPEDWPDDRYDYEIYTMDSDGSNQKRITYNLDGWDSYPSMSPDGTTLLWRRIVPDPNNERGNSEIFLSNADGTNPRNITNYSGFDGYPAWSNNGDKIVYASTNSGEEENFPPGIFVMDKDGSNKRRITDFSKEKADVRPWFSPDGSKIVFNRTYIGKGRTEIVIIPLVE
jgi:TolB protein